MDTVKELNKDLDDIRLVMPVFLLKKLRSHVLTSGLYPVALGRSAGTTAFQINQHDKPYYCLVYCHSGNANLTTRQGDKIISAGDLLLMEPSTSFRFLVNSDEGHHLHWIYYKGKKATDFSERLLMKMEDHVGQVGFQSNILNDFDNLLELGSRGYTATNVIHAVQVLRQSLSFLALKLRQSKQSTRSNFNIDNVVKLMQKNLHQDLDLDTLAHFSQLSKYHFSKKFKELTDSTPIQHFINMKIQQACFILDKTEDSIKQIGESLGYSDPYYFSRLFKKTVGMSPKQYRDTRHQ